MFRRFYIFFSAASLALFSCKVDPEIKLPAAMLPANNLAEIVPQGFPAPIYSFSNNTISEDVFVLGRALFYEPMLSVDNSISCGSCHQQQVAFAHADHAFSHGVSVAQTSRNSPALFNLTWAPSFMHDGAIPNIELQPIAPIQNTIEMGENIVNVIGKLRATTKYQELFKTAYGSNEINSQKMFKSMAQFMALMYSYRSKYDRYKRREEGGNFSNAELRGYNLFIAKCASCHKEPLFTDFVLRNNGLAIDPSLNDLGRAAITGLDGDRYKFKTPSLRNIALTGPYMHDGSLKTLEACVDHYTNGIINLTNLDPLIPTNGLQISAEEKQDIVSFLHTLTDYEFIKDKRFSNPNAR
jgi:cytochrome c peroxidase